MNHQRRLFATAAAAAAGLVSFGARAQSQPIERMRILVAFPPGGGTDAVARRLADGMVSGGFAKVVLVENRPGAGGKIMLDELMRSPADGLTLAVHPETGFVLLPFVDPTLGVAKAEDLAPVSGCAVIHHGIAVGPMVPTSVTTLQEFFAWAKANPSGANYGVPGTGGAQQFTVELLSRANGARMTVIPYKGSAPGIQDLLGGQIASMCSPVGDSLPYLQSGRLRLLATTGDRRSRFTPQVPTLAELGYKDLVVTEWFGAYMKKGTPAATVDRASAAVRQAMALPESGEVLARVGLETGGHTAEEFSRLLAESTRTWEARLKATGYKTGG